MSISIDVDLDDIYNEMDLGDKRTIAEWLMDDGILENHSNKIILNSTNSTMSFDEEQFQNNITKLWNSFYQLSNEDIEIIKNIANKL